MPAAPSNRGFEGGFSTAMMLKDLKLAQAAAANARVSTPLGAQAEALYALFERLGYGGKDFSAVIKLLRGRLDDLELMGDAAILRWTGRGVGCKTPPGKRARKLAGLRFR